MGRCAFPAPAWLSPIPIAWFTETCFTVAVTASFIDRQLDLAALERAWRARGPQLVILSGRRRVGKSALLNRFAKGKRVAYVPAALRLRADQLADAGRDAAVLASDFRRGRPPKLALDDWDDLLALLADRARTSRTGLILDEFPYLVAESPELPSLIQRWWDSSAPATRAFLVLSGSHQATMRALVHSQAPLFGRATSRWELRPLDYYQAARFVPHWSPDDRIRTYAVAGGIPAYLRLFDDSVPLRQNLRTLAFAEDGELFREADYLLESEFREVSRRGSIFRAIAGGATRPNEIAQRIGLGSAADVQPHLRELVDLGLLARVVPVTEQDQLRPRRVSYRIAEPYLRFYFTLVEPRRAQILIGPPERVEAGLSEEELDDYVSRLFEDVAQQYVWRAAAAGKLPLIQELGPWWTGSEEIDLVGISKSKVSLAGEVKWSRAPIGDPETKLLRRRARMLAPDADPMLMLFARVRRTGWRPAADVTVVTPRDLFAVDLEFERGPRPIAGGLASRRS